MRSYRIIKRTLLALITVGIAITFTQTGRAAPPCLVERGLNPLDIIGSGVLHNVWVMLGTSRSMDDPFQGGACIPGVDCKIDIAKDVIKELMDRIVDASGRPRVNWAFVHYGAGLSNNPFGRGKCLQVDAPADLDFFPDKPGECVGLEDTAFVSPPLCGDDSRGAIRTKLDGIVSGGATPLGITYTDIAEYLIGEQRPDDPTVSANTTNFVDGLLPDQKNFVIQVTDGNDTCECEFGGYPGFALTPSDPSKRCTYSLADPPSSEPHQRPGVRRPGAASRQDAAELDRPFHGRGLHFT